MGRFKLWMIIGGAVLAFYGFKEWRISGEAKADPQVLTCAALATEGYGKNAHVKMTDFLLSPGGYVYEEKKSRLQRAASERSAPCSARPRRCQGARA